MSDAPETTYIAAVKVMNEATYAALRAARDTTALPNVNRQLLRHIAHMTDNFVDAGVETAKETWP